MVLGRAIALLLGKQPKPSPNDQDSAQSPHKRVAPARRFNDTEHATEDEHRTAEQYNWRLYNRISGATVFFAAIAAFYAYRSYTEARRQADESGRQTEIARKALLAGNRAWLDLSVEIISDLEPQIDGEHIAVRVKSRNFGHSPALNVVVRMEFYPSPLFEGAPGAALERWCHRGDDEYLLSVTRQGRVIVPGAPSEWMIGDTASFDDIDRAIQSITQGSKEPFTFLPVMFVLICETYRTPEDSRPHQTAIWREVVRRSLRDPKKQMELERGKRIPKAELALDAFFPGDYAE